MSGAAYFMSAALQYMLGNAADMSPDVPDMSNANKGMSATRGVIFTTQGSVSNAHQQLDFMGHFS
jgi:hypothetical protein